MCLQLTKKRQLNNKNKDKQLVQHINIALLIQQTNKNFHSVKVNIRQTEHCGPSPCHCCFSWSGLSQAPLVNWKLPQGVSYLILPSLYWSADVHLCFPLKGQLIKGEGHHKSRLKQVSLGLNNITLDKHGPLTVRSNTPHCRFWALPFLVNIRHISINLNVVNISH